MNLLTAIEREDHVEEDYSPRPGRSTVLVQLIEGDSYLFNRYDHATRKHVNAGLEIYELQYEGGSAELEAEQGMLEDAVAPLLEDGFWREGWFVVEGFYGHYSKDYFGEVDCDFECLGVRPATWADMERFGISRRPWWGFLPGLAKKVPARFMAPGCN